MKTQLLMKLACIALILLALALSTGCSSMSMPRGHYNPQTYSTIYNAYQNHTVSNSAFVQTYQGSRTTLNSSLTTGNSTSYNTYNQNGTTTLSSFSQ